MILYLNPAKDGEKCKRISFEAKGSLFDEKKYGLS